MVRREISLDEESDRILSDLTEKYQGDRGRALADLLQAQEMIESFVDQCEEAQRDPLLAQKERSENSFANVSVCGTGV